MAGETKKKRQHYVPRMLLKPFGNADEKTCNVFVISENGLKTGASIKTQCQESYFYGDDLELENQFEKLEGTVSAALRSLKSNRCVWKKASRGYIDTLTFMVSLKGRTRSAVNDVNAVTNDFFEEVIKPHVAATNKIDPASFEGIGIKLAEPAKFSVGTSLPNIFVSLDLSLRVLVSPEESPFVLSDDPVCAVNQAYSDHSRGISTTGFAMTGLQILLPISPRLCLFYYDSKFYKVGSARSGDFVEIDKADSEKINVLSVCNADEKFFIPPSIDERTAQKLLSNATRFRVANRAKTVTREMTGPDGEVADVLHSFEEDLRVPLDWNFCSVRRNRRGAQRPKFGVRDPTFVEAHKEFFRRPAGDPRALQGFFMYAFKHFGIEFE